MEFDAASTEARDSSKMAAEMREGEGIEVGDEGTDLGDGGRMFWKLFTARADAIWSGNTALESRLCVLHDPPRCHQQPPPRNTSSDDREHNLRRYRT